MDTYFQTLIGVGISVFLFLIGYRQTVGARKERVRAANLDIEKTLLRRIVLESYKPNLNDIIRLIEGKARDHRVRIADLLSPSQFLVTLFTRIVESDFVTPDQREKILERISPILSSMEEKPSEAEFTASDISSRRERLRSLLLLTLAIMTSGVGALASLTIFRSSETISTYFPAVLVIFGISIAAITSFILYQRTKESQDEPPPQSPIESAIRFEREVTQLVASFGFPLRSPIGKKDTGYDFIIEAGDKKIIIETKAWHRRPPLMILKQLAFRLRDALKDSQATQAILLMKDDIGLPPEYFERFNVKIMSLKSFKEFLTYLKRG